ncbi:hypothetical protein [Pseudochelatococcus sp. G4_1912]|uniref:hypothetical protein n=1 Tax=Pseudochelatococcus sp. G4_1912 TaxID=3114288 RepID=UPI0039C6C34D
MPRHHGRPTSPEGEDEEIIVPARRMRPGGIGRTVAYILFFSLALVLIAWLGLAIWAAYFESGL